MQYSFHYPRTVSEPTEGGGRAFRSPTCSTSSATNSHNYLCESWTRGVQSATGFLTRRVSHRNRAVPRRHSRHFCSFKRGGYLRPSVRPELSQKNLSCQNTTESSHTASHSFVFRFDVKAQRGSRKRRSCRAGSPRGLSWPMLVVIFLSRHCSLLCSPSFLIILSAIYQTMKSERKKKIELVVSLHYGLCPVFGGKKKNVLCVLSLSVPYKKKLVVCRNDPNY